MPRPTDTHMLKYMYKEEVLNGTLVTGKAKQY